MRAEPLHQTPSRLSRWSVSPGPIVEGAARGDSSGSGGAGGACGRGGLPSPVLVLQRRFKFRISTQGRKDAKTQKSKKRRHRVTAFLLFAFLRLCVSAPLR